MQGGRDVVGSAARAVPFDRSAVSDKAAIDSPDGRPERSKRLQVLRERTNAAEPDVGVPTISGAPADGGAGNMPTCALTPRDDLTVGTNSNSSVSVAEPTMPEAADQAPRPAVSGAYSPWSVDKPHLEPVVVQRSLEERLERAERELVCAQHIDNWSRCQQETARYSRIVADLKRQIAERDAEASHA